MISGTVPSIRWSAWFRWFVVTFVGLVAGLVVFIVVGSLLGEAGEEAPPFVFGLVLGTIFGTTFGIAHWLFLRRYLPGAGAWVPATIVAFALAAAFVFGLLDGGIQNHRFFSELATPPSWVRFDLVATVLIHPSRIDIPKPFLLSYPQYELQRFVNPI